MIELPAYRQALTLVEQHFSTFEQRLRVFTAPSFFPEGEVILNAASEGLSQMMAAVGLLKQMDPQADRENAQAQLTEVETGFNLLSQVREINKVKKEELEQAYNDFDEIAHDYDFDEY